MTDEATARAFYSNTQFPGPAPAAPDASPGAHLTHPAAAEAAPDSEEARAQKLFPTMKKPPAGAEDFDALPPELPEKVREIRDTPERKIYEAGKMYQDIEFEPIPVDATPEEIKAIEEGYREVREMFADFELTSGEARQVATLVRQCASAPPDEATLAGWRAEAEKELTRVYGTEAREALTLARQLVARDPRVAHILEVTGLGSHPEFVLGLAQKARSAKTKGLL